MATMSSQKGQLALDSIDGFVFGRAPRPVTCGHGLTIGAGQVMPEINFTLPPMEVEKNTLPEVRRQYGEMIQSICRRAVELEVPGLLVEFETLPPMTVHPEWGLEVTRILADTLKETHDKHGLKCALRLTPNDTREHVRPPLMRKGSYWEGMQKFFAEAGQAGADLISIESTGGKEVCDEALMNGDLKTVIFALGVLGARDMDFLWNEIVAACNKADIVPAGDTACGFGNTAMVLAEQKFIPRTFAAVVRVATVPRSLVAYEVGARGPSKDCAYEGPYMKTIAGVPISMEGRSAACAHLSPVGNIAQAVCDCWSNESVQNIKLLSTHAPTVYLEQLAYDCRLLNVAVHSGGADVARMRDWLTESDAQLDPQAYVLRPDVVLRLSEQIMSESTPYLRTRKAALVALAELAEAHKDGRVRIPEREIIWLDMLKEQVEMMPTDEQALIDEMQGSMVAGKYLPDQYGL